MPARHTHQSKDETMIAFYRLTRGMTQAELAEATGISLSSLKRLELGQIDNPPLRWLVNLQIVFELDDIHELFERDWWDWKELKPGVRRPADPRKLWQPDRWRESLESIYAAEAFEAVDAAMRRK